MVGSVSALAVVLVAGFLLAGAGTGAGQGTHGGSHTPRTLAAGPASDIARAATPTPLTWSELLPSTDPPPELSATLAYDPISQQTLDFEGTLDNNVADVWSFAAGSWTNVTPHGNLTSQNLTEASATFDAADGYLLLFGYLSYAYLNPAVSETWQYESGTWALLAPATEPYGTVLAGLTYDASDSTVLLLTTVPVYGEPTETLTWSFHAGDWGLVSTAAAPPPFTSATMAFDNSSADQEVVLFDWGFLVGGGEGEHNLTWVYHAGVWTNVSNPTAPAPPAASSSMTFDASEQAVLLTSAGSPARNLTDRTWEFHANAWSLVDTPGTSPILGTVELSGGSDLAYDATDGYGLEVAAWYAPYGANLTTQTWKFDRTELGAPPQAMLSVVPENLTSGDSLRVTASATGGFGVLAVEVRIFLPGCNRIEMTLGTWNCTTSGSGLGVVGLSVTDQAGREVFTFRGVNVSSSSTAVPAWALWAPLAGGGAAGVLAGVLVGRRRPKSPR